MSSNNSSSKRAELILQKQLIGNSIYFQISTYIYIELQKNPVEGFSAGLADDSNIFEWDILIVGPPDTLYEGGYFKAKLVFPKDYPDRPPTMTFTSPMFHPNGLYLNLKLIGVVYKDGKVCISILHPPGDDKWGYEKSCERWKPIHSVESILLSVISMLSSPNDESPANVEAAKLWRENPKEYKRMVRKIVAKSQELL